MPRYVHGLAHLPEYKLWLTMVYRCTNKENHKYHLYGARGISVCERWMNFVNFINDMGRRPSPDVTIDRINNDGNYEPSNVRWASQKEQQNNRRDNRMFVINSIRKTSAQWANLYNIHPNLVRQRVDRDGWTIERALGTA